MLTGGQTCLHDNGRICIYDDSADQNLSEVEPSIAHRSEAMVCVEMIPKSKDKGH